MHAETGQEKSREEMIYLSVIMVRRKRAFGGKLHKAYTNYMEPIKAMSSFV